MTINRRSNTLTSPLFERREDDEEPSHTSLAIPGRTLLEVTIPDHKHSQARSLFGNHLVETSSLISGNTSLPNGFPINKHVLTNFAGLITTAMAMASPGLFGLLLSYTLLPKELPVEIRLVVSIAVGLAAAIGKYRLMRLYSQEACNWIADLTSEKLFHSSTINFTNFVNLLFSTVAGGSFAYLAKVGALESGTLARNLQNKAGDVSASIVESPYMWGTVVTANIVANMLCFPPMHKMAVGMLKQLGQDCLTPFATHQERMEKRNKLATALNPIIQKFNSLVIKLQTEKAEEIDAAYKEMYTELSKVFNDETSHSDDRMEPEELKSQLYVLATKLLKTDDSVLMQNILAVDSDLDLTQVDISKVRFALEKMIGLGLTAFCVMGLTNFVTVANNMSSELGLKKIAIVLEAMTMMSLSLMAFTSVFFYGKWFTDCLNKHKATHSEMLSHTRRNANKILNTIICLVGSTPNTYQSMVIAKQPLYLVIPAAIGGSFLLEVACAYQLSHVKDEEAVTKKLTAKDSEFPQLLKLVKKLDGLTKIV